MKKTLRYKITGITPLLQNNPNAMMRRGQKGTKKLKNPTLEEDAKRSLYLTDDGKVYLPVSQFKASLMFAGKGQKIGMMGLPGLLMSNVSYGLDAKALILNPKTGEPYTTYQEIDARTVVIQKSRVVKGRARFNDWMCFVEFECDDDFVSGKHVTETLKRAGIVSGVGDFRLSTKGQFGAFEVELVE